MQMLLAITKEDTVNNQLNLIAKDATCFHLTAYSYGFSH